MHTLELDDIQGYVIRGYAHMQYSRFLLLNIADANKAKEWLKDIAFEVTTGEHLPDKKALPGTALNISFTADGLTALGVYKENMGTFNPEFREGMITEHRQRLLGDFGSCAPVNWQWGGPNNETVHALLMVFGKDKEACMAYYEKIRDQFSQHGLTEIKQLDGQTLPRNKEHFGFRDGISQPIIKGSGRVGAKENMVNPGEFIMGYKNEYNVFPDSPFIAKEQGNTNLLATDAAGTGNKDLGRNSTYLVMRQMEQDVNAFWSFMNEQTKNEDGSMNEVESTKLAAKIVGRWPGGAPVTKFPDKDPGVDSDDDDFGYADHDQEGLKCPLGSHLRRCNPRDSFEDSNKKKSTMLSNRHRIIRRARLYGEPFAGSPTNTQPNGEVGLLFNCFNTDISRQYELIQYTWGNSTKVKQLYNDPDPLIGVRETPDDGLPQNFTIQACPVNKTITGLKRFVRIKGGAYFFFPSVTAIRYLASL